MTEVVRLVICGAAGRMGQALLDSVAEFPEFEIAAALVRPGSDTRKPPIRSDIAYAARLEPSAQVDVVVDVSGSQGFDAALGIAREHGAALVSGSTGLTDMQQVALNSASEVIPLLWSANFSLGIAVLAHLVGEAARLLPNWDCEILEAHHRLKRDAPSGTALMLGERVDAARGSEHGVPQTDRSGLRESGPVGYSVIRGGDIIGEHDVHLIGFGERIELSHQATDRKLFARGALVASRWLSTRVAGRYTMADVLGLGRQ